MLHASDLPKFLWAEAASHAVYVKNRTWTRAIRDTMPYEILNGHKPNLGNLHPCGCKVRVHRPVESKLADRVGNTNRLFHFSFFLISVSYFVFTPFFYFDLMILIYLYFKLCIKLPAMLPMVSQPVCFRIRVSTQCLLNRRHIVPIYFLSIV